MCSIRLCQLAGITQLLAAHACSMSCPFLLQCFRMLPCCRLAWSALASLLCQLRKGVFLNLHVSLSSIIMQEGRLSLPPPLLRRTSSQPAPTSTLMPSSPSCGST